MSVVITTCTAPDDKVRTKTGFVYLNDAYEMTSEVRIMEEEYERFPSEIEGMEDVRLFEHQGKLNVIYGWNSMEIGSLNEQNTMDIHTTYPTPDLFSRFLDSSRVVEYESKMWAMVHLVKYSQPRCYYHSVVQFNRETMRPVSFAAPFSFCDPKIEYCLGFDIKNDL